jgi:hypothetical protein
VPSMLNSTLVCCWQSEISKVHAKAQTMVRRSCCLKLVFDFVINKSAEEEPHTPF